MLVPLRSPFLLLLTRSQRPRARVRQGDSATGYKGTDADPPQTGGGRGAHGRGAGRTRTSPVGYR